MKSTQTRSLSRLLGCVVIAALWVGAAQAQDAVKYAPAKAEALYDFGVRFLKYEEYETAAKVFELFIEKFAPKSGLSAAAQYQLARSRQLNDDLKGAYEAYRDLLAKYRKQSFWIAMAKTQLEVIVEDLDIDETGG